MLTPHHLYQKIILTGAESGIDSWQMPSLPDRFDVPHTAISNGRIYRRQLEICVDLFRNAPR